MDDLARKLRDEAITELRKCVEIAATLGVRFQAHINLLSDTSFERLDPGEQLPRIARARDAARKMEVFL